MIITNKIAWHDSEVGDYVRNNRSDIYIYVNIGYDRYYMTIDDGDNEVFAVDGLYMFMTPREMLKDLRKQYNLKGVHIKHLSL